MVVEAYRQIVDREVANNRSVNDMQCVVCLENIINGNQLYPIVVLDQCKHWCCIQCYLQIISTKHEDLRRIGFISNCMICRCESTVTFHMRVCENVLSAARD